MFFAAFLIHSMLWVRFSEVEGSRTDDFLHKLYGLGLVWIALYIPVRNMMSNVYFSKPQLENLLDR